MAGLFDFIGDIFGGGDSQVSDVKYPDWYSDPNFESTQAFLKQYSEDLLTKGPNEYYAPIGQYGTDEFLNLIQNTNSKTLMGVNEALAQSGRARGGRPAEVAAQTLGARNADLLYKDYLRAMEGRAGLLNTGLNTQMNVRNAGFANQGARNEFNLGGANFNFEKAKYGDLFDRQQAEDIGKMFGNIVPIAGAGLGFMVGGPAGAGIGYSLGSSIGGGGGSASPEWLDAIIGSKKTPVASAARSSAVPGVSDIGKISGMDPAALMDIFASLA